MAVKPVVAVDIDDVLAANAAGFVKFSNERWGTSLEPDDYSEHWSEMWGIGEEETSARREVILDSRVFVKHSFFDEAKPALEELRKSYRLIIVSSRGPRIRSETIEWINQAFEGIFAEIHFAKIWDDLEKTNLEKLKFTKAEMLRQVAADYLIDDQPKHCIAAAEAGIQAVLFGNYKWNRDVKLRPNMVRARNWQEVLEYFDGRG